MTAQLQALIEQAHLNATALAQLVKDNERQPLESLLRRLAALKRAYVRETEAVTQAVLEDAVSRRRPRVA
jgi:outer membrane lipopolysaccharide assembly protein LptE/RlpB